MIEGLFWITDADYWRFDGINVTWGNGDADEHMVKLTGGTGWEYVNSEIWGAHSYAGVLVASGDGNEPDQWRVAGNCLHDTHPSNDTNQDHLIYANSGHHGSGVIEGNVMFNAPNGEGVKLGGSSPDSGGASNVTVRYNTIVDAAQSVLISWSSSNNLIEGNILVGAEGNYSNIRGYELQGSGNRAADNLGDDSAGMISNYTSPVPIQDAGGNIHGVDPQFGSEGCNGYQPNASDAQSLGHTVVSAGDPPTGVDSDGDEDGSSSGESTHTGAFADDDQSIFEGDIERLANAEITRGCHADRFCPNDSVTRGQMAAFLVRALRLGGGGDDRFADDDQSIFQTDIDKLARAGITTGCNPPNNDRFCPDQLVTRAQIATFLARAQNLTGGSDLFRDIARSVHAKNIRTLAAAGITRGCNPPDNNRYCPDRDVTRGQMAAFLVRTFNP